MTRERLFCVVRSATSQWWAERGHRKMRRFPVTPVRSTLFSPPPMGLTSQVVGLLPVTGCCQNGYDPNPNTFVRMFPTYTVF